MSAPNSVPVSELGEHRWAVHLNCHLCFIDVESSTKSSDTRWITFSLLSTHAGEWDGRLWTRLRYAWDVLRGRGRSTFEIITQDEIDGLLWTLYEARRQAFGVAPPGYVVATGANNVNVTNSIDIWGQP